MSLRNQPDCGMVAVDLPVSVVFRRKTKKSNNVSCRRKVVSRRNAWVNRSRHNLNTICSINHSETFLSKLKNSNIISQSLDSTCINLMILQVILTVSRILTGLFTPWFRMILYGVGLLETVFCLPLVVTHQTIECHAPYFIHNS